MLKLLKKEKGNEGIKPGISINDESESLKNTDISWCTKYSPNSIKDLAIHHSKTKAIREWLTPILEDPLEEDTSKSDHRVLILCGNSGCGKSTALELICKDMNIGIKVWTDDCWESDINVDSNMRGLDTDLNKINTFQGYSSQSTGSWYNSGDAFSSLSNRRNHDFLFDTKQKSKEGQFSDFAVKSAYPSLSLSSSGSSTRINRHHTATNATTRTNTNGAQRSKKGEVKRSITQQEIHETPQISKNRTPQIALIHDPPILYTVKYGNNSSNNNNQQDITIDSELLGQVILSFDVPVVIILSDLAGREEVNFAVDKCIANTYRQRMNITSLYCNPITPRTVCKVLERIAMLEGCANTVASSSQIEVNSHKQITSHTSSHTHAQKRKYGRKNGTQDDDSDVEVIYDTYSDLNLTTQKKGSERGGVQNVIEALSESCRGDLRHAIVQFEFLAQAMRYQHIQNQQIKQQYRQQQQQRQMEQIRREEEQQEKEHQLKLQKQHEQSHKKSSKLKGEKVKKGQLVDLLHTSDDDDDEDEEKLSDTSEQCDDQDEESHYTSDQKKRKEVKTVTKKNSKSSLKRKTLLDDTSDSESDIVAVVPPITPATTTNTTANNTMTASDIKTHTSTEQPSVQSVLPTFSLNSSSYSHGTTAIATATANEIDGVFSESFQDIADEKYSFLYTVAKLVNATLDNSGYSEIKSPELIFTSTDIDSSLLVDFLQYNSIELMMNTQRMASLADVLAPSTTQQSDVIYEQEKPSLPSSSSSLAVMDVDSWLDIGIHEQSSRDLVLWPMRDEMDQLEATLHGFSDVTVIAHRRYDTSHLLDRSQTVFPDEYVSSISSRICSCARSAGAKERIESAKQSGVKSVFQSIRKPKTTSLRYKQGALRSECLSLRNVVSMLPLVSANTYTNSREVTHKDIQSIGILYSSKYLAVELVPYLKIFYSLVPQPAYTPTVASNQYSMSYSSHTGSASTSGSSMRSSFSVPTSIIHIPSIRLCLQSIMMTTSHQNNLTTTAKTTSKSSSQYYRSNKSAIPEEIVTVDIMAEVGEDIDSFD